MVYQASMGKLPDSPKNVDKFWAIHCYNIGGQVFTLDEIEHGVLRDNQGNKFIIMNKSFLLHYAMIAIVQTLQTCGN